MCDEKGGLKTADAVEIKKSSTLRDKILKTLSEGPSYPKEISRKLKTDKQRIYYHMKELEKQGFVKASHREYIGGAVAKYYRLSAPAFVALYGEMQPARRIPRSPTGFLSGHIKSGLLDCSLVIGSPDPHGPEKARSRDVSYVADLAMFLGTFVSVYQKPRVMLDTDVRKHDLSENLIIVGGPVTNKITKLMNEYLPVRFDKNKNIFSSETKKTYRNDYDGFIANAENPYDSKKRVIVIAGKKLHGTRAAVLALMQMFDEISKKQHTIVEGIDLDGDGIIDGVRILE